MGYTGIDVRPVTGALQAIWAGESIADYMQRSQPDNVVQIPVRA
jgi:hypothetical protein